MSAFLGNPMVTTAALPLLLGIAFALLVRLGAAKAPVLAVLIAGAAVLFLYWDTVGAPAFPPIAASQKLVYLAAAGIIAGLLAERRLDGPWAGVFATIAIVAAFAWLGWRRIAAGPVDLPMAAALITGLLTVAGAGVLMAMRPEPSASAEQPFLAPAAVLSLSLAGAIISVLGASIVVGQLLGSLAALTGGWCLFEYLAVLRGRPAIGWGKGVEFLFLFAAATALIQVALLAPKADPAALMLSPLPLFIAALSPGRLEGVLPGAALLRPLLAGLLIAVPAILAVLIAIIRAPHGAALGFS
ncbi:hypothetical protein [Mesorhizobium sp. INR15]|uniref:hypothetical protein n=1 Tax=Mesorhizobium sp. INR15 TaxID=2654248 RepID=UPI0018965D5A|nr:hypothetical protein [Mesorhizobium sp. INR15]QPC91727.1 hypothetical protein GA829_14615 [Mesorhizobium sp. INR15]